MPNHYLKQSWSSPVAYIRHYQLDILKVTRSYPGGLLYDKIIYQYLSLEITRTGPLHDDAIKWKHFPRYWPFVRRIHRSPVNSPHKGQWRGAFMFTLICIWINGWVNNREAGGLRCSFAHYDVTVMHDGWVWWGQLLRYRKKVLLVSGRTSTDQAWGSFY